MSLAAIRKVFAAYVTGNRPWPSVKARDGGERPKDLHAQARKSYREAGAFVAADGKSYPVGPCGYVPRSAQFDPLRKKVR